MKRPTARCVAEVAGCVAVALFIGGIISCASIIGPGKGGNIGAATFTILLWLLATIATAVALITRRCPAGGGRADANRLQPLQAEEEEGTGEVNERRGPIPLSYSTPDPNAPQWIAVVIWTLIATIAGGCLVLSILLLISRSP